MPTSFTNTMIPPPARASIANERFDLSKPVHFRLPADLDPRIRLALDELTTTSPLKHQHTVSHNTNNDNESSLQLSIAGDETSPQSYGLIIKPNSIHLTSPTAHGLSHAIQTLRQLPIIDRHHWPCLTIEDAPAIALRGLSFDVSRGRVPTLDELKRLVDFLASLKMNHLQLYVEHTFDFKFDPDISDGCSPLTPDDIHQLDRYAHDRFIDFVPSLASFGHMGRILSLPQYQHLAEIPPQRPWLQQDWPTRIRGLTIDPQNPQSRDLISAMHDEFFPLFSSSFANVNADETHDLARGRHATSADPPDRGRLYVDHLKFLADSCRRHGKRMMFWADVVRSFPALVAKLPEDVTLLDWGYAADSDYPALTSPHVPPRQTVVCCGTSGWNQIINDYQTATINIARAAKSARSHASAGLIVTDWGDHGHFNLPTCSKPAIAMAAAHAWSPNDLSQTKLDAALNRFLFADGQLNMSIVREAANLANRCQTWPALYTTNRDEFQNLGISPDTSDRLNSAATTLVNAARTHTDPHERNEWTLAGVALQRLAQKVVLGNQPTPDPSSREAFADRMHAFIHDYANCWNARYRPDRLTDITAALKRIAE
jgi:hexosaminidase